MSLDLINTGRGFALAKFEDLYGTKCSIQKSSLATQDAIWLGVSTTMDGASGDRMHLSREQVADLLPLLQRFVQTGELAEGAEVVDAVTIVQSERAYQDEFAPDPHDPAKLILLMEHYLHRARTDLLCPQMVEGAEGSSIRKVGALALRFIEEHGAPMRRRRAGEPRDGGVDA